MKKYQLNIIKTRRSYTAAEICELLGVCKATVGHWVKEGLPSIKETRPNIILGQHLKEFLAKKLSRYKFKLEKDQLPCLR